MQRPKQCGQEGCNRNAASVGLCSAHYQRRRYGRSMSQPIRIYKVPDAKAHEGETCRVTGCERGAAVRGLCKMHYARDQKHGDPLALNKRGTKRSVINLPNETSPTKLGRLLGVSKQRAHQLLNREAHNARMAVTNALHAGRLVKPDQCERCSAHQDDLEAHHWDYREPLDVRWLCPPCHSIVHPHHPTVHGKSNQPTERAVTN